MYDLVNTLIHELVHNTFGPHDEKFWNLFRKYKKEYDAFHDFYSRGGQTTGGFSGAILWLKIFIEVGINILILLMNSILYSHCSYSYNKNSIFK